MRGSVENGRKWSQFGRLQRANVSQGKLVDLCVRLVMYSSYPEELCYFTYMSTNVVVVWISTVARDHVKVERRAIDDCQPVVLLSACLPCCSLRLFSPTPPLPLSPSHASRVQVWQERWLRQGTRIQTVPRRLISMKIGGVLSRCGIRLK